MVKSKVSAEVIPQDRINGAILTNEEFAALRELVTASRTLYHGAKMMRALGTGGVAPGDPRMRALDKALLNAEAVLLRIDAQ